MIEENEKYHIGYPLQDDMTIKKILEMSVYPSCIEITG